MTYGEKVKEARKARKWNQFRLAHELGWQEHNGQTRVSRIENGADVDIETRKAIRLVLGIGLEGEPIGPAQPAEPEPVVLHHEKWREKEAPYFANREGGTDERLYRSFRAAADKAGLEDVTFHDLRHTFASRLVVAGVNLVTVQRLLGHSSVLLTQRYAHLAPGAEADAVRLLSGGRSIQICSTSSAVQGLANQRVHRGAPAPAVLRRGHRVNPGQERGAE